VRVIANPWPQQAVRVRAPSCRHNPQDVVTPPERRTRFRRSACLPAWSDSMENVQRGRTAGPGRAIVVIHRRCHTSRVRMSATYAVRSLRGSRIVPLVQTTPHALPLSSTAQRFGILVGYAHTNIPPVCQTQKNLRQGPVMQEEIPFTPSLHLHRLVGPPIGRFVEPLIERWSVLTAPVTRAMLRGRP